MTRRFWILGGSGKVGSHVFRYLTSDGSEVFTVSRRASGPGGPNAHVSLDLAASDAVLPLRPGDVVVNLTESTPKEFAAAVLRQAAVFIETSATPDYVLSLRGAAQRANAPGILVDCVGMAPGLTNLMSRELIGANPDVRKLFIGGELGLGEHAGGAATGWFFQSLGATSIGVKDGAKFELPTGKLARKFRFADGSDRLALNFPFIEQQLLAEEFGGTVDTVLTYLAFSPPWVTRFLLWSLRLKIGGFASRHANWLAKVMLAGPAFGEATTRIAVCGEDRQGRQIGFVRLETGDQSLATAAVVAATARAVDISFAAPVSTIADWLSLDTAVDAITARIPDTSLSFLNGAMPGHDPPRIPAKPQAAVS